MAQRWLVRRGWALAVGSGLTVLAVALHLTGFTERAEWDGLDFYVRHFSRIPASERIVHIDIGDDALDRVGSWPWPRDLQAELVRVLNELGAEQIVIDIVWSDPKPPVVRLPGLERFADVEGPIEQIGEASAENVVYPDDELADAIADAGNVCLAMYYETEDAAQPATPLEEKIADLLREDFELDVATLATPLDESPAAIEKILPGIKRRVAEQRVETLLKAKPSIRFRQVHEAILSTPFDRLTADRADVLAAYHRALSLRTLRDRCPLVPKGLQGKLPRVGRVIPPVYKLSARARRTGFVTFRPDRDGRTRHVPLLLEWDGCLMEHLAFAAARDACQIELDDLSIDDAGDLVIAARGRRAGMRVQLDPRGQMLINWHVESAGWPACFMHRPVTLLLQLADCRRQIQDNNKRRQWKIGQAIRLLKDDAGFDLYRQQVNRMLELERRGRWAALQGRADTESARTDAAEARRIRRIVERDQQDSLSLILEEWAELESEPDPSDPEIAQDYKRFRQAAGLITRDVAELDQLNERLAADHQRLGEQLRPMIEGKICFVGYTATAVADMVTTPPYRQVPGVMIHSNVLNAFLQGQFRTWSPGSIQVAMIALFGLAVTFITATRGPKLTFVLVVAFMAVSFLLNAHTLFENNDHWLPLITALVLLFITWAMIVLLRYLTSEREKRRFSRAVAQYVSPAMARRIADSSVNLDLSPVERRVTCFFSDLASFTPMSERLGPEGTKALLNPYLEAMSEVLHRHHALINKFMGDGVFAFFNPPILPCPDHEVTTCEAALDSQQALRALIEQYANQPLAAEFRRLFMRIGIASGPVFVGDYGSENKLDYTCVGDTVNLASRLESANKVFGTMIMIAGPTCEAAGDRYLYRDLGALQVKGRTQALPVYELLGHSGEVNDDVLLFAETFGKAVAQFVRRSWSQSTATFERCLEIRPNDPGTKRYLKTIQRHVITPPPENWNGELELAEK